MNQKFKENAVVAWHHFVPNPIMIARVVKVTKSGYHLLYLDGSSGWHDKEYVDEDYKELGWSAGFFELFMLR